MLFLISHQLFGIPQFFSDPFPQRRHGSRLTLHIALELQFPFPVFLGLFLRDPQSPQHSVQIQPAPLLVLQQIAVHCPKCQFPGLHGLFESPFIVDQRPSVPVYQQIGEHQIKIRHRAFFSITDSLQILVKKVPEALLIPFFQTFIQQFRQGPARHIFKYRMEILVLPLQPAFIYAQSAALIAFRQLFPGPDHPAHMRLSLLGQGIFTHCFPPLAIPADLCTNLKFPGPVVGILYIFHGKRRTDHSHVGIGEHGKKPLFHYAVKGQLFIKKHHAVPVKIPQIVGQLPPARQTLV